MTKNTDKSTASDAPGAPKGIWDEKSKQWIRPSGTVKQDRRPMFKAFAQHSPLPWETGNKDKWVYVEGQQNPIAMLENAEDAKLIVRAVNHADKLAEALREAWEIGADHRKPDFDTLNKWAAILARIKDV